MRLLVSLAAVFLGVVGCGRPVQPIDVTQTEGPNQVTIQPTRAEIQKLLEASLPAREAAAVAAVLEGVAIERLELSPDGKGRGELVHRQRRDLYVRPVTAPSDFRVGLSLAEVEGPDADRLLGLPGEVQTVEQLAVWLSSRPANLTALSAGSGADRLPLTALLGLYRLGSGPVAAACTLTPSGAKDIFCLHFTVDQLNLPVEFRFQPAAAGGALTLTCIDGVAGEAWERFVSRRLDPRRVATH